MPWYRGPTLLGHLETVRRRAGRGPAVPARRAVDQPRRGLPRLCRHRAGRQRPSRRRGRRPAVGRAGARGPHRHLRRRPRPRDRGPGRHADARPGEVDVGRGDVIAAAGAPPHRQRPVRRAHRVARRCADAAGAALSAAARHRDDDGDGERAEAPARYRQRIAARRPSSSSRTTSASPTCRSTARCPSTPTTTTARPAASS